MNEGKAMKVLSIKFKRGTSEDIEDVFDVVDHGCGEISYFIGSSWTRYHALDVESFEVNEVSG